MKLSAPPTRYWCEQCGNEDPCTHERTERETTEAWGIVATTTETYTVTDCCNSDVIISVDRYRVTRRRTIHINRSKHLENAA
jgi:hypothetical protein